ncbi:hypothetical protein LT493_23870 [Streptomyces tricolor]|nr:hypothetical protein [Streptomyces tricolor]
MRRSSCAGLDLADAAARRRGGRRAVPLVLRSFVMPFYVKHAPGLLTREADILRLLADTDVPAARLRAVDAAAEHCRPSVAPDVSAVRPRYTGPASCTATSTRATCSSRARVPL